MAIIFDKDGAAIPDSREVLNKVEESESVKRNKSIVYHVETKVPSEKA
jgi:hypothetical protein